MARATTEPVLLGEDEAAIQALPGPTILALRRLLHKKIALVCLAFILMFYVVGASAPLLGGLHIIPSYTKQNLNYVNHGPIWPAYFGRAWHEAKAVNPGGVASALGELFHRRAWAHPMGTDILGRDQFSRVVWAAETTVIVTVATLLTGGLLLAVGLGLISGYVGGWVDTLIMRIGDVFASLPTLLMLILINATMKAQVRHLGASVEDLTGIHGIVKSGAPDYILIFGALSLFSWVGGARVIRSQILSLRETEFILAARALGASTPHILFRHLLPQISNLLIVSLSMGLAGIAGSEIVLTWFGVGIQPPHPSFGALIFDASSVRTINVHPYLLAFPAGIVVGLFFAFNLLGDALTDVFTPRTQ